MQLKSVEQTQKDDSSPVTIADYGAHCRPESPEGRVLCATVASVAPLRLDAIARVILPEPHNGHPLRLQPRRARGSIGICPPTC